MHHGRAQTQQVTLGGTRGGQLLAYHLDVEQDAGAYTSLGVYVPEATLRMTTGVYAIPRARGTARARHSATTPVSAYRGSGRPEATVAIERAVDVFAREIGMDPVELRRRNLVDASAFPFTTPVGTVYDSGDYEPALDTLLVESGYEKLRAEQEQRRVDGDRSSSASGCRSTWSRPPPARPWNSAPSRCGYPSTGATLTRHRGGGRARARAGPRHHVCDDRG